MGRSNGLYRRDRSRTPERKRHKFRSKDREKSKYSRYKRSRSRDRRSRSRDRRSRSRDRRSYSRHRDRRRGDSKEKRIKSHKRYKSRSRT